MVFTGYRVDGDIYSDLCSVLKKYGLRATEKQAKANFFRLPVGLDPYKNTWWLGDVMQCLSIIDPAIFSKYKSIRHEINNRFPIACPKNGSFIAYKRVWNNFVLSVNDGDFIYTQSGHALSTNEYQAKAIATLEIPDHAKRSSAFGNKCRASEAIVKDISVYAISILNPFAENEKIVTGPDIAYSKFDPGFVYRVGETVKPEEPFDNDRWKECASGIHFFMTLEEALAY